MKFANFILLIFLFFGMLASAQALEITNIDTTEADCPSNGSATITATGGDTSQPYLYAIISGPVTFPPQLSNVFNSLPPGSFTVEVSDNSGTSVQDNFTIIGSYVLMNPTMTTVALQCPSANDGSITVSVVGGKAPYEYSLITPSAEERSYQPSNVFTMLPEGNYTVQVRDACGNIQTRTTEVDGFTEHLTEYARYIGVIKLCSTVPQSYEATLFYSTSSGGITETDSMEFRIYDAASNTLLATVPHVDGTNPTVTLPEPTVISSGYRVDTYDPLCDRIRHSFTRGFSTNPTSSIIAIPQTNDSCDLYDVRFQVSNSRILEKCDTTTWTLTDTSTGTVVQSFTTDDLDTRMLYTTTRYFRDVPLGNYDACFTNCCGETFCDNVDVIAPTKSFSLSRLDLDLSCLKETTTAVLRASGYNSPASIELISGPSTLTTSQGTFTANFNPGDIVFPTTSSLYMSNMGIGTYVFRVSDNCGQVDDLEVIIGPDDVLDYDLEVNVIPGCVDENSLELTWTTNAVEGRWRPRIYIDGSLFSNGTTYEGSQTVVIEDVPPGELRVEVQTYAFIKNMFGGTCPKVIYEDTIEPYQQPEITDIDQYSCVDGTGLIVVSAEKGIAPYTYELYQGGSLLQTQVDDGQFLLPNNGNYDVRVVDSCFNSTSTSVSNTIPLAQPNIVAGFSCDPNTLDKILDLGVSPINGASYEWKGPDNTVIGSERTLQVTPFELADVGQYTITVFFAKSPNCISTSATASYTVNMFPCPFDYGDAPVSYGTLFSDNGARHPGESTIFLGILSGDIDSGILNNALANADDGDNNDDEDGVSIGGTDLNGQSFDISTMYNFDVTTTGTGYLSAWIDFNRDGDFMDAGEKVIDAFSSSGGVHAIPLIMPGQFSTGDSYIRFRYSTDASMTAVGSAPDGEVEDYQIILNGSIATIITNRRITYRVNPD